MKWFKHYKEWREMKGSGLSSEEIIEKLMSMLSGMEDNIPETKVTTDFNIAEFKRFQSKCEFFNTPEPYVMQENGRPFSHFRYKCAEPPVTSCNIINCPRMSAEKKRLTQVLVEKDKYDFLVNKVRQNEQDVCDYDITVKMEPLKKIKLWCMNARKRIDIQNLLLDIKTHEKFKKVHKDIRGSFEQLCNLLDGLDGES